MKALTEQALADMLGVSRRQVRKLVADGAPLEKGLAAVVQWLHARPQRVAQGQAPRLARLHPADVRGRSLKARTALRRLDLALARGTAVEWDAVTERVGNELAILKSGLLAIPGRIIFEAIDPAALLSGMAADHLDAWPSPKPEPDPEPEPVADGPVLPQLHPADPRAIRATAEAEWLELQLADARQNILALPAVVAAIRPIYERVRGRVSALKINPKNAKQAVNDLLRDLVETEECGIFTAGELERRLVETVSAALRAPPLMKLPEWADRYRHLAASAGSTAGPWRTSRVEVARGPMMAVTEPGVQVITIMSATQMVKTSLLENVVGYFAHLDPSPILLVQPKDESVAAFSKERLAPMVKASPVLRDLIRDGRSRVSGDTLRLKQFPGGILAMVSAGSPANLAMRAIRVALLDEIDKYEATKEGDPIILAEERLATFNLNRLAIRACSPTWEETSRINRSYNESDQRRPFVDCPECGHEQTWDFFRHVHWAKGEDGEHFPETAKLVCEGCKHEWTETERQRAITTEGAITWKQTASFMCCGEKQSPEAWDWDAENQVGLATCKHCHTRAIPNRHAGFHCSKLYSPFISVVELAQKWIGSKDEPESKITFYNTQLGEAFSVEAQKSIASNSLVSRVEQYAAEVPRDVVLLTAGIDVQSGSANEGRLEVEVVGWGLGEESWSITHEIFLGDPAKPDVWNRLDEFLKRPFKHELGVSIHLSGACIDSGGHHTQECYSFAKTRAYVWAVKGASDRAQWSPIWPPRENVTKKWRETGFKPVIIGVSTAKDWVRRRLWIDSPGPGFCHFPIHRSAAYFDQLTAEDLIFEKKHGVVIKRWRPKPGRANEALDCRVYAVAALHGLKETRGVTLDKQHAALMAAVAALNPATVRPPPPSRNIRRSEWMNQ